MSRGWHHIGADLGIIVEQVSFGPRVTVTDDWLDDLTFDETAAWDGLLAKHAAFADFCDRKEAAA